MRAAAVRQDFSRSVFSGVPSEKINKMTLLFDSFFITRGLADGIGVFGSREGTIYRFYGMCCRTACSGFVFRIVKCFW